MKKMNYESEAYNAGCIAGFDALVVDLHNGFDGAMPRWLLSVIGGKKAVAEALGASTLDELEEDAEIMADPDFNCGEADGYEELLGEVEEAYKERGIEMPMFLLEIVGTENG